jgi:hypothetical protein
MSLLWINARVIHRYLVAFGLSTIEKQSSTSYPQQNRVSSTTYSQALRTFVNKGVDNFLSIWAGFRCVARLQTKMPKTLRVRHSLECTPAIRMIVVYADTDIAVISQKVPKRNRVVTYSWRPALQYMKFPVKPAI